MGWLWLLTCLGVGALRQVWMGPIGVCFRITCGVVRTYLRCVAAVLIRAAILISSAKGASLYRLL